MAIERTCAGADCKLLAAHDVVQQILHFKGGEVEEVLGGFVPSAFERPRQLGGHNLNDEADSESQHFHEQVWFGSDEHGEIDEELLCEHGCTFIVTVCSVDKLP